MTNRTQSPCVYPWGHTRRFNDYPTYIKNRFGFRVQKISVNTGFSCPNRDGTKGTGGCVYCDNSTFRPGYCRPSKSVKAQIHEGVAFFEEKYPLLKYMAYFQSYTNTYAPVKELEKMYLQALEHPKVVSLIVGTRPDCINSEIIELLSNINKNIPVVVEFGLESTVNKTLELINRCHTWEDSVSAIELCYQNGIETGGHLIMGLPGENRETMILHAKRVSELPLATLKLHQLQVIKNTKLAEWYAENPQIINLLSLEEYLGLVVDFLEVLSPDIVMERIVSVSPVEKLVAPKWNKIKNFEIIAMLEKRLLELDTWQGKRYVSE